MGVNCRLYLPENARVRHVANVIGVLSGLPVSRRQFGGVEVAGVKVRNTVEPSMAQIKLYGRMIDGEVSHETFYHFESDGGSKLMTPKSRPYWVAVCCRLVMFFGGKLIYQDCSYSDGDYEVTAKSNAKNQPRGDPQWTDLQDRIASVTPLTMDEIEQAKPFAAYED